MRIPNFQANTRKTSYDDAECMKGTGAESAKKVADGHDGLAPSRLSSNVPASAISNVEPLDAVISSVLTNLYNVWDDREQRDDSLEPSSRCIEEKSTPHYGTLGRDDCEYSAAADEDSLRDSGNDYSSYSSEEETDALEEELTWKSYYSQNTSTIRSDGFDSYSKDNFLFYWDELSANDESVNLYSGLPFACGMRQQLNCGPLRKSNDKSLLQSLQGRPAMLVGMTLNLPETAETSKETSNNEVAHQKYHMQQGGDNDLYSHIVDIATTANEVDPLQKWSWLSQRLTKYPNEATFQDENCRTPLSYACEWGNDISASIVKDIILCHPEAVSMPDKDGKYPLHYYASSDKGGKWQRTTEVLQLLLDYHPRATKKQDNVGNTPLLGALEAAATAENTGASALKQNLLVFLKVLLKANPETASMPNAQGSFPLHFAAKGGNPETIELLVKHCPDALWTRNKFGVTPLFVAIHWNASRRALHILLRALPRAAAIPDTHSKNPISYVFHAMVYPMNKDVSEKKRIARNRRNIKKASSVHELERGLRRQWEELELLARAAYHNSISSPLPDNTLWRVVHALCGLDVPPELVRVALLLHRNEAFDKDEAGRLPIHIAAATPLYIEQPSRKEEVKHSLMRYLLLEDDSVAKIVDNAGRLPIHYATEMHKPWVQGGVKYLVRAHPSSLWERDGKTGLYPFMLAAMQTGRTDKNSNDRRSRAERKARNESPRKWHSLPLGRRSKMVDALMEEEELEELDAVFHLIRAAPDLLLASPPTTCTNATSCGRSRYALSTIDELQQEDEGVELNYGTEKEGGDLRGFDEGDKHRFRQYTIGRVPSRSLARSMLRQSSFSSSSVASQGTSRKQMKIYSSGIRADQNRGSRIKRVECKIEERVGGTFIEI